MMGGGMRFSIFDFSYSQLLVALARLRWEEVDTGCLSKECRSARGGKRLTGPLEGIVSKLVDGGLRLQQCEDCNCFGVVCTNRVPAADKVGSRILRNWKGMFIASRVFNNGRILTEPQV